MALCERNIISQIFPPCDKSLRFILVSLQLISSITEGVSTAASSTEEPMQTDETPSAEAAPAEEGATAMETQAEVNTV